MSSEFHVHAHQARTSLDVPPVPLLRIRARAGAKPPSQRIGRPILLLASVGVIAAGAATAITHPTIRMSADGTVMIDARTDTTVRAHRPLFGRRPPAPPSAAQVAGAARLMSFRVTLPAALPDPRPISLMRVGTSAMVLSYNLPGAWRRSDHLIFFTLADPAIVDRPPAPDSNIHILRPNYRTHEKWTIGGETVIVTSDTVTPAELARVKRAMEAAAHGR